MTYLVLKNISFVSGFSAWLTDNPADFDSGCSGAGYESREAAFLDYIGDLNWSTLSVVDFTGLGDKINDFDEVETARQVKLNALPVLSFIEGLNIDVVREGEVTLIQDIEEPEPGSLQEYHSLQYRPLQAGGTNCSDQQFAEWFVYVYGGSLNGDGRVLDFGEVKDCLIDVHLTLKWSDYVDARKALMPILH